MNNHVSSTNKKSRFQLPITRPIIPNPFYGQIWNNFRTDSNNRNLKPSNRKIISAKSQCSTNRQLSDKNAKQNFRQHLSMPNLNSPSKISAAIIDDLPSSIYRFNNRDFLHSLRNFNDKTITYRTTSLARYMKMSREIVDDFVRSKSQEFDQISNVQTDSVPKSDQITSPISTNRFFKKNTSSATKKRIIRPKSSFVSRRRPITNGVSKNHLTKTDKPDSFSDEEIAQVDIDNDKELTPLFHQSMEKISSIAHWERQIRYELEIEKELQKRELERQREKLKNDQRKLEDWDKLLRIELDARERKLRIGEDELKSRLDEFNHKTNELIRREQMINEIVNERIKGEMKFEIEKLRKKYNELEMDKSNLTKKEERVKEAEARLHEQVKIVKEKIDSKRISDIELAKYRKELEITKKENEVLKEKVDSMEDYQITKFENRAFKNELQILKETLENKNQELERDRERWEREQRTSDQKIITLKRDLHKAEQELILLKQKFQADNDEITSKYEAANGQVKRLQTFIKDHLAKLNDEFSTTKQTLNPFRYSGGKLNQINHYRGHSLHQLTNSYHQNKSYNHQRSISMDGFNKQSRYSQVRGCRLCSDDEIQDYNNNKHRNGIGRDIRITNFITDDDEEEIDRLSFSTEIDNNEFKANQLSKSIELVKNNDEKDDEFVRKIVDKIYEKMSHKVPNNVPNSPNHDETNIEVPENSSSKDAIEEKSVINRSELNFDQTPVHPSLFEELINASKMEKLFYSNLIINPKETKKLTNDNKSPEIKPIQNGGDIDETGQNLLPDLNNEFNHHSSNHIYTNSNDDFTLNTHNDTNNNRINNIEPAEVLGVTDLNSIHSNSGNSHQSTKSESFEIDW